MFPTSLLTLMIEIIGEGEGKRKRWLDKQSVLHWSRVNSWPGSNINKHKVNLGAENIKWTLEQAWRGACLLLHNWRWLLTKTQLINRDSRLSTDMLSCCFLVPMQLKGSWGWLVMESSAILSLIQTLSRVLGEWLRFQTCKYRQTKLSLLHLPLPSCHSHWKLYFSRTSFATELWLWVILRTQQGQAS